MLPVQIDVLYRTGASAVAISVISTAVTAWALSSLILRTTGSTSGALAAAVLLVGNPNVLYLQSTPMTEPLLFATTAAAVALTAAWIDSGARRWPASAGVALAAACLTRYEAWPIAAATIAIAGAVLMRRGGTVRDALRAAARLAAWPAAAVLLFLINSRWTVGAWFVSGGFFVPENTEALGHPLVAWAQVREGLYRLSGSALVWPAYAGAALVIYAFVRSRSRASLALVLALAGAAALPCYAYMQGHPFRIRYDVPLVAACAALTGAGIGLLWSRARPFAAAIVVAAALFQAPPLDRAAPLIAESQREAANMAGRRAVTDYLVTHRDDADHHDEHGLARPLHARSLGRGVPHPGFPARGQRRPLELRAAQTGGRRRLDCDRGARGGRRLAVRPGAAASAIPRRLRAGRGRGRGRAIPCGEIAEGPEATDCA